MSRAVWPADSALASRNSVRPAFKNKAPACSAGACPILLSVVPYFPGYPHEVIGAFVDGVNMTIVISGLRNGVRVRSRRRRPESVSHFRFLSGSLSCRHVRSPELPHASGRISQVGPLGGRLDRRLPKAD